MKGSFAHDMTFSGSGECAEIGTGSVTAEFKGRSKRFRLDYGARGGYRAWAAATGPIRLKGEVTAVDNREILPGEACGRIDKSGCVTRPLRHADAYVDGTGPTRRRPGLTFDVANLTLALGELRRPCELVAGLDFSRFDGAPRKEFGRLIVRMPRPSKIRRRAFTVTASDRNATQYPRGSTRTVRKVKLRFKPA